METINFSQADVNYELSHKRKTRDLIKKLFLLERVKMESFSVVFCSDTYLLKINREYLNHDYYTDIITFDLSASNLVEGELYISVDRVKENAKNLKTQFSVEILRVIIHGALHLCGYKDKTSPEEKKMRMKEDYYLNKL